MKKVILCLLLLIPILVILTITASGRLIASALVDIPVESVFIKHEGEILESKEIHLEDYKGKDKKFTLFCEVFPGIATDEMLWESSEPEVAEVIPDPKRNAANVVFHDYGSVDIVCTSKKNSSITARATLYVGGLIPGNLTIGTYDGGTTGEIALPLYGVKSLLASVKPARSVIGEKVQWSAADPTVIEVDNNGVITARKQGETTVTATVTARGVTVSDTVRVKVEGTALVLSPVVYATGDFTEVDEYLVEGASVVGGNQVTLQELSHFESKVVTVKKGDAVDHLRLVKLPTANSLVLKNRYALSEGALSSYLALGTSNLELTAFAPYGDTPAYEWRSSDESIVSVQGNRVYAVGSGTAEVYPYAEGYRGEPITISVTLPVEDFRLSEHAFRDQVGLLQERVFGNVTYLNGEYTPTYQMSILSVYPSGAGIEAFTFESTDPNVATVNDDGLVTFAQNVEGKKVTIAATAYNQEGTAVRQNYTFKLVNGVNIGYGQSNNTFDKSKGEKPSFSSYYDFKTVTSNPSVKAVVLLADVYFPSKSEGGVTIKNFTASIYGNGKKLDGQFFIDSVEETDKLLLWDFAEYPDMPANVEVSIINTNLQATQPTSDDAQTAFTELSERGGGSIGVRNGYPEGEHHFGLYVKGCLFQYAFGHVNVANGDSVFDGCIFRNNSASAVVLQQSSYGVANVKVKNCIFSNTIAPVGIACGNFEDLIARFKDRRNSKPIQLGTFELEGTNYVYNWKKLDDVQMDLLPRVQDQTAAAWVNTFNGALGQIIRNSFMASDKKNMYLDENGDYWLNFSFLMLGIWDNINPQINKPDSSEKGLKVVYDEDLYQTLEVNAYEVIGTATQALAVNLFGADLEVNKTYHIVCRDKQGTFNTMPGETYTIGEKTYARLRGETDERA